MNYTSYKAGFYNVIRWPDAKGTWWLVAESERNGYIPVLELRGTTGNCSKPTYANQRWQAAKLLVDKGIEAVRNPHGLTGRICGCHKCFCCAALEIEQAVERAKV